MENDYSKKYELLKLVTDLSEKESDRGGKRYTLMLATNGGLFVFLGILIKSQNPYLIFFLASISVIFCWNWIKIVQASYYYEHRWHADMEAIINSEPFLSEWVRGRSNPRIERPHNKNGMSLFGLVPKFMVGFWSLFVLLSLIHIFSCWNLMWA